MSWRDRLGNRRGEDEDYDAVEAELQRAAQPQVHNLVECPLCGYRNKPGVKCKHPVDWNERGGR
jgi:hypothetical protein